MNNLSFYIKENYSNLFDRARKYDISFPGDPSKNGWKLSIVGKSKKDAEFLYNKLHKWLSIKNIAHKFATGKRVDHKNQEQSKKLATIYVPDGTDHLKLAGKIENLLKGYKGWQDIKLPFKGYEHYSNGIFFRNDRDESGNYIPAKSIKEANQNIQDMILDIWEDKIEKISIFDNKDNIELSMIKLKDDVKRQGIGSKIMNYLCDYADKHNKIIHLTPDPSMGTNLNTLKSFYMKHGFNFNKGVHKDYRFRNTMIRHPHENN